MDEPRPAPMMPASLPAKNYFSSANDSFAGFHERIDASEVISNICNELRGIIIDEHGRLVERPEFRMMNEKGVARVRALLVSIVNKVSHLSKYENNARVLLQVKSQIQGFIPELTCSLRKWAPEGMPKVPNWILVIRMVEQSFFASMLRGEDGFEAKNLTQQHNIMEMVDGRQQEKRGLFDLLRGR